MVTAHPDDVDFGAAGSIATWVKAGIEVAYCIVTNGDAGGSDRSISRTDMAQMRQDGAARRCGRAGRIQRLVPRLPRRPADAEHRALRRDVSGRCAVPTGPLGLPVAGAQLGPDRRQPPGPPGGR